MHVGGYKGDGGATGLSPAAPVPTEPGPAALSLADKGRIMKVSCGQGGGVSMLGGGAPLGLGGEGSLSPHPIPPQGLIRHLLPLGLVYFAEYFINQGLVSWGGGVVEEVLGGLAGF